MIRMNGSEVHLGQVSVEITGNNPEDMARALADRIISVGGNCHPLIRDQAIAYQKEIYEAALFYMRNMARASKLDLIARLRASDMGEVADIIEQLEGKPIWQ